MKATEFAYWLQGYFEISGGDLADMRQITAIYDRLRKVELNGKEPAEAKAAEFARGLFYIILPAPGAQGIDIAQASAKVKAQLNDLFIHAIDPSYKGDQTQFNTAHTGGFPPREPGVRC